MPPNSNMEDLLKASARKRRAEFGADPTMPNPTRVRLHDEIARLNRVGLSRPGTSWLSSFWPQLSAIGAVAAVLLTAAVLWPEHEDASRQEKRYAVMTPAPPEGLSRPAEVAAARSDQSVAVPAAPAAAAPLATERFAGADIAASVQQQATQPARGQAMRNNSTPQAVKILSNFQVEQEGNEIRLVDADGSTYSGRFEIPAAAGARRMAAAKAKAAAAEPAGNERFFRASGFNATLQKRVVFEGNYIPLPVLNQKSDAQMPARIIGTAKVGGETPVEVDAATVSAR